MYTLARVVRLATTIAVALLVAGILIHVLGANTSNGIVSAVNDAAKWLAQPFHNVFSIHNAKTNIAVNWGLAAVVYAVVGGVIATLLARSAAVASTRRGPWRRPAV
jgi:archaellum component FlaG (FlaF/FlaG flagellin family)